MKFRGIILTTTVILASLWAPNGTTALTEADSLFRIEVEGKGTIVIRLATDKAPKASNQLIQLAKQKFYDGQRWFRVVTKPRPFLIQTGDPNSRDASKLDSPTMGTKGAGGRVPFEQTGIEATEGAVFLAAKPGDRDSGDSQFFILLDSYRFLEGDHTAVGRVIEGMDVVRRIAKGDLITSIRVSSSEAALAAK
jgi:cyclophilin family peptidyl-prolyl cis-trans isomerase